MESTLSGNLSEYLQSEISKEIRKALNVLFDFQVCIDRNKE